MRAKIGFLLLLIPLLSGQTIQAGEFMDVRLSWVLSENNFLADPGDTFVNSPGLGIGADESNTLFFDNYETKYTGFETFGHLVLYKKMPAFFDDFYAEAALFMKIGMYYMDDEGSYVRFSYDLSGGYADDENIELTLFPLNSDRFRLGYSYDISWGGDSVFLLHDVYTPAAKLQVNLSWIYGYLGIKTTRIEEYIGETSQTEMVTNYGVLGGFGVDIKGIRAEVCGGYFSRGTLPHPGVRGRYAYAGGVSYQVGYHHGTEIGIPVDFELYKNDPYVEEMFFRPEVYDGGLSFVVRHEGTLASHRLMDPDVYGELSTQYAYAFDVNFALKYGFFRVHLDAVYQSLSFLLFDSPSFTPFQDFPDGVTTSPEMWAAIGVDYHFEGPRLTPGIKVGIKNPATYTITDLQVGGALFEGSRTVVVQDAANRSILPEGYREVPMWSIKASCRWDYAEMLGVVLEVYYTWDDNQTQFVSDFQGLNISPHFIGPNIIGLNLMAQARY